MYVSFIAYLCDLLTPASPYYRKRVQRPKPTLVTTAFTRALLVRSIHRASLANTSSTSACFRNSFLKASAVPGMDPLSNIFRDSSTTTKNAHSLLATSTPLQEFSGEHISFGLDGPNLSSSGLGTSPEEMRATGLRRRAFQPAVGTPSSNWKKIPALSISSPNSPEAPTVNLKTDPMHSDFQADTAGMSDSKRPK